MSYYRKYRPQVIDEIDNASVREQLLHLLSKSRNDLPHAYLFTGPKGTGKTTSARVIAKVFNCMHPTASGPCGSCEECLAITKGSSLDVVEMDAASNRGIDEIRQLRDRIGLAPVSAPHTVYIIDEVHMLTNEAFNALLKTLEEPPDHAVFVLATTDAHKVPPTIKSRCMEINFHRATLEELESALHRVAKGESLSVDDAAIRRIAESADGSFRDAVKLLEQASLRGNEVTESVVAAIIPTMGHEKLGNFLTPFFLRDAKASLEYVQNLLDNGFELRGFLLILLQSLEAEIIRIAKGQSSSIAPMNELKQAVRVFLRAFDEMRYSPIPSLPLELAIIEYCSMPSTARSVQSVVPSVKPEKKKETIHEKKPVAPDPHKETPSATTYQSIGLLTYDKLVEHWTDFIIAMKPHNHSVAGVLRSSRPKEVQDGIVTIEAFYKFHQEKLADIKTCETLEEVLRKLFGEKVKVKIVLGKK